MRAFVLIPYFTIAAACGVLGIASPAAIMAGPTEGQMRAAFEESLTRQVRNALDFAAETGGPAAVALIRAQGHDRFSIAAFRKLGCVREPQEQAYRCDFSVAVDLTNGNLQKTMSGRFTTAPETRAVQLDALLDDPLTTPRTRA